MKLRWFGAFWCLFCSTCLVAQPKKEDAKTDSKNQNPDVQKAEELFRKGQVDESFKELQAAVKKTPTLPPARLMLVRLYLGANQLPAARGHLEAAFGENPDHPDLYLTNGSIALGERRLTDTILNCRTALTLASADRWTAEQRKTYQKEARAGLATAFELRQDWVAARTELTFWLEFEPKNTQVRQRLGRALFMMGEPDKAYIELQTAYKDDPTIDVPEVSMGNFANMKEDYKKAQEWFEKAIDKFPKNAKVHQAFGGWLLDTGKHEAAKIHIETATALEPKSRETLGLKGLLARYQRDFSAAEKAFEEILRDNPGDFFASNQLALVLAESNDSKQQKRAIQLAEVNARQYNRNIEALGTLGWVFFRSGRLQEADQALGAASSTGQVSPDLAYYVSKLLHEKGKTEEARKVLEKALESKAVFVNRKESQKFITELKGKEPSKKN